MKLILIVEDEYGNAEILQILLEGEVYRTAIASNGRAAWELLQHGEKPDLILSDFMMPIMTGGEFGAKVREVAALRDIPFIFMTATSEDVVQRAFSGYDALLAKPFEIDVMLALIERLIAHGRPVPGAEPPAGAPPSLQALRVPPLP